MPDTGRYKVVFLSDGTTRMRTVRFSRATVTMAAVGITAVLGSLVYGSSRLMADWFTRKAMTDVMQENIELHRQFNHIGERLNVMDEQLKLLTESDDQLRLQADIPLIDKDTREVGIGGNILPEVDYEAEDTEVRKLIFNIDKLEREVRLQRASYDEIQRQFGEREDLLAHTPSIRPLEGGYVSSFFGMRDDPFNRRRAHHNGIDISVERGTPISASADGVVIFAKRTPGLGNLCIIDHGYGFRTAYGHMSTFNIFQGQNVTRGQKIGEVGNTGRSTAPHLHYEVHVDRKAVDPLDYIFDQNIALNAVR